MKINYLEIIGYKNLENIFFNFEDDTAVHALIGNNGSGKSNVLEALAIIFSSVYLKKQDEISFAFVVDYTIDEDKYSLSNKEGFSLLKNGKRVAQKDFSTSLPNNLFLYYCGETMRLKEIADYNDASFEKALKADEEKIKFASFICLADFEALLISLMKSSSSHIYTMLQELLDICSFGTPIVLHIAKPSTWGKSHTVTQNDFWNAYGTVATVLHAFKDAGELVILNNHNAQIVIHDLTQLKLVADTPFDMFVKLKLLMQADILRKIDVTVVKENVEIPSSELSEGEKQLSLLLSLLEITKEYKPLFLLDEFDSYLHPNWQRKFAELIADIKIRGQVIFTTHSPLTLGKLQKENIRILKDGEAFEPVLDTFNRDITEVLEEIMEVGKRPKEVESAIKAFRESAIRKNAEQAKLHLKELQNLLSDEDPFWATANHLLSRLEG